MNPQAPRPPTWIFRPELKLLLVGLIALLSCGLLWWSNQLWWQSYATYVPATDNLRLARHDAAMAFLLQGKQATGERVESQQITALLDSAAQRVTDMLAGQSALRGVTGTPLADGLREQTRDYQQVLNNFILVSKRLQQGIGEPDILRLNQRNAFHAAEQAANRLETELVLQLGERLRQQEREQKIGLLLWLGFLVLLFLLMLRSARIEAALARQQRLMEAVVRGSGDAIFVKDLAGRYELFNEGAARIVGKPVEEVLGQTDAHIFSPDTAALLADIDRRILAGGKPQSLEERLTTTEGEQKIFWVTKGPLVEANGQVSGLFGISRDITEQKRAEAALATSEARFRAYIESAPLAVWVLDAQGRFQDSNPEGLKLLELDFTTLLQQRLQDRVAVEDQEALAKQFRHLVWKGRLHGEFRLKKASQDEIWMQLHASRINDNLFIVYGWDISARREQEQELAAYRHGLEERVAARTAQLTAAEAQARLLLESTADGLFGVDTDGRLTFINPAACRLLGYPAERLLGRPVHQLIHGKHEDGSYYPGHDCPIMTTLREGRSLAIDHEVYWHADGHALPVFYTTHPMQRDGQIVGAVVSFMDMTERRALEAEREKARQEAERLARIKSDFLANMSHEIRTPLNGVLGMAQVGFRAVPADHPVREHLAHILNSGQLLLGIINDILDFSKIESGRLKVETVPVHLPKLLADSMELIRGKAREKGLQLDTRCAPTLPQVCLSDPLRLEQILANLLSNSVKFTEQGCVTLEADCRDGQLIFAVRDTGIGMDTEAQARIFTPFEQADSSTGRKFGGTGLGLAISQRLAELLGGNIRVDSTPGLGSCFELHIPYLATEVPVSPAIAPAPEGRQRLAGMHLLVAEDNKINQLVMEHILHSEGATYRFAENGREALALLAAEGHAGFHAVLMDVQMPEMDGLEATRELLHLDASLPVIGQTAHALAEDRARCLAAGMVAYLTKPIDPEQLVATLLQHGRPRNSPC